MDADSEIVLKGERDVVVAAMAKSTGGSSRNGKVHERKIVLKKENVMR